MNRDLLVRVGTAAILLPLVIWLIWLGGPWFALLVGSAAALCSFELNLLPFASPPAAGGRGGLSGAALVSIGAAFALPMLDAVEIPFLSFKVVVAAVVVLAFADALLFEREPSRAPLRVSFAVLGAVYPGLMMSALIRIRQLPQHPEWWIVLTLVVTWWNDTGGYFAGRAFGKHKLFERISPKKTWEGAAGGLLLATVGAVLVKTFWIPELPLYGAVLIAVGASVLGPLGDLSESMLKRAFGAKDSGKLLPGHGGMLDRIDALLFNAPFVLLCARLLLDRR